MCTKRGSLKSSPPISSSVAHAVTAPKAEEKKDTKKKDGTKKEKKGEPESEMLRR
jgi:hypothetical protein